MDFAQILSVVGTVPPVVVTIIACVWCWSRWLEYREKRNARVEESAAAVKEDTHESICESIAMKLDMHIAEETERSNKMLSCFDSMNAQLVVLASKGELSSRNQKLMIQYQWNWLRDEVCAAAADTMRRSRQLFVTNRELVTRKLAASWRSSAKDAEESLARLEGMTANYKHLFHLESTKVFTKVWKWMLMPMTNAIDIEPGVEDVVIRTRAAFEDTFQKYCASMIEEEPATPDEAGGLRALVYEMGKAEECESDCDMPNQPATKPIRRT